jgi:hypothetical protein
VRSQKPDLEPPINDGQKLLVGSGVIYVAGYQPAK